jgi:DNA-binding MarR family transcriptional regulator
MKLLDNASIKPFSVDECADRLVNAVPLVMKAIRKEIRNNRPAYLSLPQFRVLAFVHRREGASLSDVAEHIGITLPTASKLVDGLVKKDLVLRKYSACDRRRAVLNLTAQGRAVLEASGAAIQPGVARMLATLSPEDLYVLGRAAEVIQRVFAGECISKKPFPANNSNTKTS